MTQQDLKRRLWEQRKWIDAHGGDIAGYITRYGEPGLTDVWYGEGGSAIYRADRAELDMLGARVKGGAI